MRRFFLLATLVFAAGRLPAADFSAEMNKVLSQLQSMGHGFYTDAEWQQVIGTLDGIVARARSVGDWNSAVEANVIKAMVFGDMKRDYRTALVILEDTRERYGSHRVPAMKKVYVREAETYARMGDEGAVQRVMQEFEASPHYDPEYYPFSVGAGRDTPLTILRPKAATSGSISMTAMSVAKRKAQYAVGALFPGFHVVDARGREWTLEDFRGKVLLVDFWARDWTPWKRDLDNLRAFHDRYDINGFEVLGICLEPAPGDLASFAASQRIPWPLVGGDGTLAKQLGLFGEAANFLVDRNGVIIGRDLRGADLAAAAKRALTAPPTR